MGYNISNLSLSASVFQRETGWEFMVRAEDSAVTLELLTPGVSDASIASALSAHDPLRFSRQRVAERSAAIATLSASSIGQAVLQLMGVSDASTRSR